MAAKATVGSPPHEGPSQQYPEGLVEAKPRRTFLARPLGSLPGLGYTTLFCLRRLSAGMNEPKPLIKGSPRALWLGRGPELAQLCDGLADALQGRGRVLLVRGEAGIGKTRLAQELATHAISKNALVLWGRCSEGEGAPPFWPWSQAIRACVEGMRPADLRSAMGVGSSYIASIVPELKDKLRNLRSQPRSESGVGRFQLFNAVRTFLARASRKRPIILVLDDLHWADHPSLLLLELLVQELANMSVLVVGTYREGEVSHPLVQTLGELARAQLETLELRGLSQTDVGLLLTAVTGERPPGDLVRLVHGHTGGNPFFATEVARLLGKSKAGFPIPDNVKSALSRRLSHLSNLANRLLIAASVIGRELDLEVLERTLVESDRGEVLRALEETMRALILEPMLPAGERYQFRHALIRDALYEELSPSRKARWHARVAKALEETLGGRASDRAVELAHHVVSAGQLISSEKVMKYSTVAGQRMLTVHAYEEALPHFERAWKAREGLPPDADAATILFGLGYAQAATALRWNRQEAWANLRGALEYQIETGNIPQAVAIATHPCITPEGVDGVAPVLDRLLTMVLPASREEGWLRSRWGAATYFETGDYRRTQEAFERALTVATAQADVALELRTLAYATAVDHFAINKQGVLSKSRRAIDLARRIDDLHAETYARYRAAYALVYGGSPDEARLEAEASLACAERLRDYGFLADALYANSALAQLTGDWSAAREHSDRGLALSPHQVALLQARMLLEYETGNSDAARDYLQRLVEADRRAGPYPLAGIFAAVGIAQAVRLEKSPAHLKLSGMARALLKRTSHIAEVQAVTKIGQALFAIEDGDIGQCAEALEHLAPLKGLILWPFLVTDRLCGLLAQAAGLTRRAATEFESALDFYRRAGYRPEQAWTCYDYARLLLERVGRDDREKASTLLAEARGIASELGMHPLATLVDNFQERYRSRLVRKPAGLTVREVEILHLLVRGKTNKEMAQSLEISANTVAVHVARILRKTGSSNRTEAAAFANREHLVGAIASGKDM